MTIQNPSYSNDFKSNEINQCFFHQGCEKAVPKTLHNIDGTCGCAPSMPQLLSAESSSALPVDQHLTQVRNETKWHGE